MKKQNHSGFTLIELLLSMVFGLIVLAGVIYVYIAVVVSTSETLKKSKLNTQLMTAMSVMSNDIRRASYWSNTAFLAPTNNPFNIPNDALLVIVNSKTDSTPVVHKFLDLDSAKSGSCILYSYDRDEDGNVDSLAAANEYFGFRLDTDVIQMRSIGNVTDGDSCSNGTWNDLTDNDIYKITTLTFNPQDSACVNSTEPDGLDAADDADSDIDDDDEYNCYKVKPLAGHITVETREILITLSGELINDSSVSSTITQSVRVRNDRVRVR